jgi:hypothetical protein
MRQFNNNAKVIHCEGLGVYGILGNNRRLSYGFVVPGFIEMLGKLSSIQFGESQEFEQHDAQQGNGADSTKDTLRLISRRLSGRRSIRRFCRLCQDLDVGNLDQGSVACEGWVFEGTYDVHEVISKIDEPRLIEVKEIDKSEIYIVRSDAIYGMVPVTTMRSWNSADHNRNICNRHNVQMQDGLNP